MTTVVLTQPFLFPWVGLWEQMQLADVFVHYDDVQFSKGHFTNRVQLKTAAGPKWMTIPLANASLGVEIGELRADESKPWRSQHRRLLLDANGASPHLDEALAYLDEVYVDGSDAVCETVVRSLEVGARLLGLDPTTTFLRSSELAVAGKSSQRVVDVVKAVGGDVYVTGQGAKHYLDHELFEEHGIEVRYMDYAKVPYPQLHGEFTPYVSVLDLVANVGAASAPRSLSPRTLGWRDFLAQEAR